MDAINEMTFSNSVPIEFCFDDEPVEHILYGTKPWNPSCASVFAGSIPLVRKIEQALESRCLRRADELAFELRAEAYPVSREMCLRLSRYLKEFVPGFPNPKINFDLSHVEVLGDTMWGAAEPLDDPRLADAVGGILYWLYEHIGRYAKARKVLRKLIDNSRKAKNRQDEAFLTNNLGFEYLWEKRWKEAQPFFSRAADLFRMIRLKTEFANARANFLACELASNETTPLEEIEEELVSYVQLLELGNVWQRRKPLVLLARINERKGKTAKAVRYMERLLALVPEDTQTCYPEEDAHYLAQLIAKRSKVKRNI